MKSTQLLFLLFISVVAWAGGPAKSNFTAMEVNHIRVNTPGLFNERKSFSIHLDRKENEYCKVISAYGARRGHSGTDIKTKANDTIRCAFDGIVRMAKTYAAYGNVVIVYNEGTDYFDVTFHRDGSPEEVRVYNNVALDGLVDLIDSKVEKTDEYEKRVSDTYDT